LKWIFERCEGSGKAEKTAIGFVPAKGAIDKPAAVSDADMSELETINAKEWLVETGHIREHYSKLGPRLPVRLMTQLEDLEKRLK
jgi:phosphoenolpyruvate carboxykinase (GTP)